MFISVNQLANELPKDKPDNFAANALQEGLGGQFGEMRTMMQYLFQNFNFRGTATPYRDLIKSVASEEIGHVELISTTIGMLLDGSTNSGAPNKLPLNIALEAGNIHHFLVASQGAMPVDSAGNPWSGSYVYNSGNLVLDLLYNLMLECTGRLQKCRLYAMSDNKSFRATVSYLIVRDLAHRSSGNVVCFSCDEKPSFIGEQSVQLCLFIIAETAYLYRSHIWAEGIFILVNIQSIPE